jgi:hypothetical protein
MWIAPNGIAGLATVDSRCRSNLRRFWPRLYLGLFQQNRPEAVITATQQVVGYRMF